MGDFDADRLAHLRAAAMTGGLQTTSPLGASRAVRGRSFPYGAFECHRDGRGPGGGRGRGPPPDNGSKSV